jgi:segregation and condensation protein A
LSVAPVSPTTDSAIHGYQLRLPNFEGPLDVLLRLIERNQLEITEVSLVEVTDQFLSYVAALPETSPGVLAEFTAIASRLLVLKSRSLLPSEPVEDEETESDDLTQQLLAYKAIKDAAIALKDRQDQGTTAYRRPPVPQKTWGESAESILPMPAGALLRAIRRCATRQVPETTNFRPRPVISLAEMTCRIVDHLRGKRKTRFSSLLSSHADRHEQVAGFVALLTLWKQRTVELWQPEHFAEIEIEPTHSTIPVQEQVADD